MKQLIFSLAAFVSLMTHARAMDPDLRVLIQSPIPSSRGVSRGVTPSGTPRSQRRNLPYIITRRLPRTPPNFPRRSMSAPTFSVSLRGLPLPPTLEAVTSNPRIEERWLNLLYQFHLNNEDTTRRIKDMVEDVGSVKLDVVCGMTERTASYALGEANNYDMAHRVKMVRNGLADVFDMDARRFKPGRVEIAMVGEEEEETCAIRVSPHRLRTVDEAFDDLMMSH